jgi:hypothetical protein
MRLSMLARWVDNASLEFYLTLGDAPSYNIEFFCGELCFAL